MKDFAGRTAFITGGASGIGLGMARVFLGSGVNVAAADLHADHIAQAKEALASTQTAQDLIPGLIGSPIYRMP